MYCFAFYQVGNETTYEVDLSNLPENNLSLSDKVFVYFKMIRVYLLAGGSVQSMHALSPKKSQVLATL